MTPTSIDDDLLRRYLAESLPGDESARVEKALRGLETGLDGRTLVRVRAIRIERLQTGKEAGKHVLLMDFSALPVHTRLSTQLTNLSFRSN